MFRLIKIIFNAFLLVLAIIGFNAIGGQKYIEVAKHHITSFIQERAEESAKKLGNFADLHEEFEIDNTVNLLGYRAVIAEHNASGQKMCIVDSKKKPLLTQSDIKSADLEKQLQDPSVWADQKLASELGQQVREIKETVSLFASRRTFS